MAWSRRGKRDTRNHSLRDFPKRDCSGFCVSFQILIILSFQTASHTTNAENNAQRENWQRIWQRTSREMAKHYGDNGLENGH
jgi:hypothetical protein